MRGGSALTFASSEWRRAPTSGGGVTRTWQHGLGRWRLNSLSNLAQYVQPAIVDAAAVHAPFLALCMCVCTPFSSSPLSSLSLPLPLSLSLLPLLCGRCGHPQSSGFPPCVQVRKLSSRIRMGLQLFQLTLEMLTASDTSAGWGLGSDQAEAVLRAVTMLKRQADGDVDAADAGPTIRLDLTAYWPKVSPVIGRYKRTCEKPLAAPRRASNALFRCHGSL